MCVCVCVGGGGEEDQCLKILLKDETVLFVAHHLEVR